MDCLLFILSIFISHAIADRDCYSRNYGRGSTVCVCTPDHCDSLPLVKLPSNERYVSYITSKSGLRFDKETGSFSTKSNRINARITVDSALTYQYIQGWGGSLTDSTASIINSLSTRFKEKLIKSLFAKDGLEYNLFRTPIGDDFSTRDYSNDDDKEDTSLENFELSANDKDDKIPVIKKIIRLGDDLYLMASMWGAPRWSDYYLRVLEAYKDEGVEFSCLALGSEKWQNSRLNIGRWVENRLGPTIRDSDFSSTNLMLMMDPRKKSDVTWGSDLVLSNTRSRDYLEGLVFRQCTLKSSYGRYLNKTEYTNSDKPLFSTQICEGSRNRNTARQKILLGDWSRAENYASSIIQNLQNYETGWIGDNMAVSTRGTSISNPMNAPIVVNTTSDEFYKQPLYYVMGHFSKFVPRGSVRISSSQWRKYDDRTIVRVNGENIDYDDDKFYDASNGRRAYNTGYFSFYSPKQNNYLLESIAFKRPDDGIVVILLNKNGFELTAEIKDKSKGSMEKVIPPHSIATIFYS